MSASAAEATKFQRLSSAMKHANEGAFDFYGFHQNPRAQHSSQAFVRTVLEASLHGEECFIPNG
jgi:hypothetical protein